MSEQIKILAKFPVPAKTIYNAWLNSKMHSEMTGSICKASTKIGGKFTAWDGYVSGKNLELINSKRILQSWRSSDFQSDALDSILLVKLEDAKGGCSVTIIHSEIPRGLGKDFKQGWIDYYFLPMKIFFK